MAQNAAAGGNFRKDLTLSLHNLNEAGDKSASIADQFDFVKVDPNDYEDYRDNRDATPSSFDGVSDAHGIVLSGGSTMYDGIIMSGGSTMYEGIVLSGGSTMYDGLADRIADERDYGDDGSFDFKGDLLGDDF